MSEKQRQLFVFWQFDGNNHSWCNFKCEYCYGGKKEMKHYWNGDISKWEKAFEKLNRDIYFVMSYGESMGMNGFYECVAMIGRHPTWTLCIVSNLSFNPTQLVNTWLAKDGRLFMHPCWHPIGSEIGTVKGWERFRKHLLILKAAKVPTHVLYLWYKPQIKLFPEYFEWLDAHDFRVNVRRYVGTIGGVHLPFFSSRCFGGKTYPKDYTTTEREFIYANTCPKVTKYGLDLVKPTGTSCSAGKDMILVKNNGDVAYCADLEGSNIGNIFDVNFKLFKENYKCSSCLCGGDYGMLHLIDESFSPNPVWLPNQPFLSIAEDLPEGHPVPYPNRKEMLKCLQKIKEQ